MGGFFSAQDDCRSQIFFHSGNWKSLSMKFIKSRLDNCNSLYLGVAQSCLSRLQLVQNATARLLTETRTRESITPVLARLHWLPIENRIQFKVLLFIYRPKSLILPSDQKASKDIKYSITLVARFATTHLVLVHSHF